MSRSRCTWAVLAMILTLPVRGFSQGTIVPVTIYSTFLPGNTYVCCTGQSVTGSGTAQGYTAAAGAFTPTASYDLSQIDVAFYFTNNPTGTRGFTLSLNQDAGGVPGTAIATWTGLTAPSLSDGPSASTVLTVAPYSGVRLIAGNQYWVVATPSSATSNVVWDESNIAGMQTPGGRLAQTRGSGWTVVDLASGTLVFDVLGTQAALTDEGSIAQIASGGGWTTTFTLVNTSTASAQATLSFFDNDGRALPLPVSYPINPSAPQTTSATIGALLKPGAQLVIQSTGPANSPPLVGWASLASSGGVSALGVFSYGTGNATQEAGVSLDSRVAGAFVLPFDNTGSYSTGIAIANTSAKAANVPLTIRDETGALMLNTTLALPALGHTSLVLATNYPVTSQRRGTVELGSSPGTQIRVLGIRGNAAGGFTSIPAVAR